MPNYFHKIKGSMKPSGFFFSIQWFLYRPVQPNLEFSLGEIIWLDAFIMKSPGCHHNEDAFIMKTPRHLHYKDT